MTSTIFLARLIGLITIFVSLAIWLNRRNMVGAIEQLRHSKASLLIVEMIGLAAGLAIVLLHNDWHGVLAIVVTLLGWFLMLRALALMFLPNETIDQIFDLAQWPRRSNLYALISFILGIYLTIGGFAG
jgi:hypothetical protein